MQKNFKPPFFWAEQYRRTGGVVKPLSIGSVRGRSPFLLFAVSGTVDGHALNDWESYPHEESLESMVYRRQESQLEKAAYKALHEAPFNLRKKLKVII